LQPFRPSPRRPPAPGPDGKILLTVFLKHDQAMNLNEINEKLAKQGYYEKFPPPASKSTAGTW